MYTCIYLYLVKNPTARKGNFYHDLIFILFVKTLLFFFLKSSERVSGFFPIFFYYISALLPKIYLAQYSQSVVQIENILCCYSCLSEYLLYY